MGIVGSREIEDRLGWGKLGEGRLRWDTGMVEVRNCCTEFVVAGFAEVMAWHWGKAGNRRIRPELR